MCYFSTLVFFVLYQVAVIVLFIPCLLIWSKVIKEIICSQLHFLEFPEAGNSALQLCLPPILFQINFALTLQAKQNKQAVKSKQCSRPRGGHVSFFSKNVMCELFPVLTKAVTCLHVSLLFGRCWILQSKKYRLWINVTGSVQEEICP